MDVEPLLTFIRIENDNIGFFLSLRVLGFRGLLHFGCRFYSGVVLIADHPLLHFVDTDAIAKLTVVIDHASQGVIVNLLGAFGLLEILVEEAIGLSEVPDRQQQYEGSNHDHIDRLDKQRRHQHSCRVVHDQAAAKDHQDRHDEPQPRHHAERGVHNGPRKRGFEARAPEAFAERQVAEFVAHYQRNS